MPDEEKPSSGYIRALPGWDMTPEMAALHAAINAVEHALHVCDIPELKRRLARVCLYVTLGERQLSRREWLADIQRQPIFCRYDKLDIVHIRADGSMGSVRGRLGRSTSTAAEASASGRQIDHFDPGWTRINGVWLLHYFRITATRQAAGLHS